MSLIGAEETLLPGEANAPEGMNKAQAGLPWIFGETDTPDIRGNRYPGYPG